MSAEPPWQYHRSWIQKERDSSVYTTRPLEAWRRRHILSSSIKPLSPDTDDWLNTKSLKAATPSGQVVDAWVSVFSVASSLLALKQWKDRSTHMHANYTYWVADKTPVTKSLIMQLRVVVFVFCCFHRENAGIKSMRLYNSDVSAWGMEQ